MGGVGAEFGAGKSGCPLGDGIGKGPGLGVKLGVGRGNGGSVGEPTAAEIPAPKAEASLERLRWAGS